MMTNVTSGRAWRKDREEGTLLTLPVSGNVARVRSIDATIVAMTGRIPDGLTPIVVAALEGKSPDEEFDKLEKVERFKKQVEFAYVVCRVAFTEPRIVDQPSTDDEIAQDDLHPLDALFVVRWLNRAAGDLDFFRSEQDQHVESIPPLPADPIPAVAGDAPEPMG